MSTIIDENRKIIQIEEEDSVGNSLVVGIVGKLNEDIYLEINNPWSGDSETGFGRTAQIFISDEDAIALGKFLLKLAE